MIFRVDHEAPVSLAAQIATQIRLAIASGELTPGERLPPARELSTSLRLNMHTVLRAYQELRDDGLIAMRQGRGAFVCHDANAASMRVGELVAQLVTEARKLGVPASDVHARIDRLMGGVA